MATIFDIAKEAGVSITTVSRALNGYSDVSAKTRQRIMKIARELNYYPSSAASSLQGKRTNTIAFAPMLRDHIESEPFFKEFIGLLTLACFRHDLSLLATVTDSPDGTAEIYRELAGTGRVDGIILADIKPQDDRISLLQDTGLPFVAFGRTTDYAKLHYPLVDVDGAAGIRAIIEHLYRRGHRRIAYLSGPFDSSYALHRYSGYVDGLSKHGLREDKQLVVKDLQERAEAELAVSKLLDLPEKSRPTAIVASSDRLALQALYALERRGVRAGGEPGQVAITGFDDLPFAAYLHPSLTTVRQPIEAICDTLLDVLVALIKNREMPESSHHGVEWVGPQQILLEPELVVRDSA